MSEWGRQQSSPHPTPSLYRTRPDYVTRPVLEAEKQKKRNREARKSMVTEKEEQGIEEGVLEEPEEP